MTNLHPKVKSTVWRKSSRSASGGNANCVEARTCSCHGIAIRDSKHLSITPLTVTSTDWVALLSTVAPR